MPKVLQSNVSRRDHVQNRDHGPKKTIHASSPIVGYADRWHDYEQNMVWYREAVHRANGKSALQRPEVDRLRCQGRTIYDASNGPAGTPEATGTQISHQDRRSRSTPKISRRRSLIDETLCQAENGKILHKVSPTFVFDMITAPDTFSLDVEEKRIGESNTGKEGRLSTPSLTWSDEPDGSDTEEALLERLFEANTTSEPVVVVNPFPSYCASSNKEYRINAHSALGSASPLMNRQCDAAGDRRGSFASADEFFEMFVNTEELY